MKNKFSSLEFTSLVIIIHAAKCKQRQQYSEFLQISFQAVHN